MRRLAKTGILALGAVLCAGLLPAPSFAQSPDPKTDAARLQPGAYYWTGKDWQAMEPLEWSANGVKKTGKSSVWSYRHPAARVQLKEASPLFCYKLEEAARDSASFFKELVIARLDPKKDHREFETTTGDGAFAFRAGLKKDRARRVTVTDVAPDVFLIAPQEPLAPGEYVLGGSSIAISGFDFGIHPAK